MKSINYAAAMLAALALGSCSNDEVVNNTTQSDPNAIKYSVITNNASRAEAIFKAGDNLTNGFLTWAYTNSESTADGSTTYTHGKTYFSEDKVSYTSANGYTQSYVRYWPSSALTFFAVAPNETSSTDEESATYTFTFNDNTDGKLLINNYQVEESTEEQKDLLYAKTEPIKRAQSYNEAGTTATGAGYVKLNFRHALAQLVFKAENKNPTIHVEIGGVKLCHIDTKGTATIATATTQNYNPEATTEAGKTWGTKSSDISWSTSAGGITSEVLDCTDGDENGIAVTYTGEGAASGATAVSLFPDATSESDPDRAMMVIPQDISSTFIGDASFNEDDTNHGDYFVLSLKIWNVADESTATSFTAADNVQLLGTDDDFAEVLVPITISDSAGSGGDKWEAGKKYTYTFTFTTDGNGGIPKDDNEEFDPENPSLLPIKYSVQTISVDAYANGGSEEKDVNY